MYQQEFEVLSFPSKEVSSAKNHVGVLELHIHTDPWDPFLSRAKRVPNMLNYFPKSTKETHVVNITGTCCVFKTHSKVGIICQKERTGADTS